MKPVLLIKSGWDVLKTVPFAYAPYKNDIRIALRGDSLTLDSESGKYLKRLDYEKIPDEFVGFLGLKVADIMNGNYKLASDEKIKMGKNSVLLLNFSGVADDIIDGKVQDKDKKKKFIRYLFDIAFNGTVAPDLEKIKDMDYRGTFAHARAVYSVFQGKSKVISGVYENLMNAVFKQFEITNLEGALINSEKVGALSLEVLVNLNQEITGNTDSLKKQAIMHWGSYAQLLDDLVDTDEDLIQGNNTFPALFLKQNKNTKSSRREIKRIIRQRGIEHIKEGISLLDSKKSRETFQEIRELIDLKYSLYEFAIKATRKLSRKKK